MKLSHGRIAPLAGLAQRTAGWLSRYADSKKSTEQTTEHKEAP